MKRKLIIIILIFLANLVEAQGEANNWYFGDQAGITFNSGVPTALTDGALNTDEGCATISDSAGQLLFYTDGVTVYNRMHNIMLNGAGLLGDFSSTQSSVIVPKPNDSSIYYIFTVDEVGGSDGLRYSIVDMTLDGGFGAVTATKNILLITPVSEKINAVLHANGQDIWVLTHGYGNDEFYAYLVTSAGINTTPITSNTGVFIQNNNFFNTIGVLKASPNGNKLVMCVRDLKTQLFNFNNFTGTVSNPVDIYTGLSSLGAEFSPSGNILYVTHNFDRVGLWQYNLTATDIPNSGQLIYQVPTLNPAQELGQLQLGPDSKIYLSIRNRDYLSAINNPEDLGLACNFNSNAVFLDGKICKYGLPTFIQSYFYVGFQYENVCLGEDTSFTANISQAYDSLLWDFGDGNTSTVENPLHTYTSNGNFTVTLTVVSGTQTSTDTKLVVVYESPSAAPIVELSQCDDDLDGFSAFNLNEAIDEITTNAINETISFYETISEAENEINAITNTTDYINQTVSSDAVWVRVENSNGCYSTAQLNLTVSTTQIPLTFTRDFYECDDGVSLYDGVAMFDFSSVNNEIQALFPAGQQLIINYYKNQTDALAENDPVVDIFNYQNIGYPNTQNIYIRVDSAVNNDCLGLGEHITLHVEEIPLATGPIIIEQCDINNDGTEEIDTSSINTELLQGQTNVDIVFTDANNVVLPNPLPNPLITGSQSITATMTNTNSIDPDGACSVWTTIDIIIDPGVVANPVTDFIVCDNNDDGQFAFDTSTVENTVLNGQTGTMVTYRDESGIALPSPLPNPFVTNTQTITVTVVNPANPICFAETDINFIVNDQPIANTVQDDFVCDDASNDGEHVFSLLDYNTEVLNGQPSTLFGISYHTSQNDADINNSPLSNSYLSNITSETIFVRIENNNNTSCFDTTSFQIGVSYLPIATQPENISICDDESNDGFEAFNLSNVNTEILNGQSSTENIISYHLSQDDADNAVNAINSTFTNTENPQTIFVRLENNLNSTCYTTAPFSIVVYENPVLNMEDFWTICEDGSIEIEADAGYENYLWSTGETTSTIIILDSGTYTVTASNNYGSLICDVTKTITVVESNVATITNIETIDWSQNNNAISVEVEGDGDYEYSLDGFTYQDSNELNNLVIDDYTVYVRDKNGCGITTKEVYLLFYPNYFTPNGDTIHETWQIYNTDKEPNNVIYIFNRYGKLITQLKASSQGWDGTLKGNPLPASDYWFVLNRQNGKQYKGHFTLKR